MSVSRTSVGISAAAIIASAGMAWASASPLWFDPTSTDGAPAAGAPGDETPAPLSRRRIIDGEPTKLGFKNTTVEQIVPFIVETTGKVVMPQRDVMQRPITVLSDKPLERALALDLLFQALQQNGVGVIETDTTIMLRDIGEVLKGDVPVISGNQSVLDRTDYGTIAQKVYPLKHLTAKSTGDMIKDALPDFAKLTVDEESNQVAVLGNIGLLQRFERLITSLDRPGPNSLQTETFRLRYADPEAIKTNIQEVFGAGSTTQTQGNRNNRNNQGRNNQNQPPFLRFGPGGPGGQNQEASAASTGELRVTSNTQQNSVTVAADPAVLDQVRHQIETFWDIPLTEGDVAPKTYDLQYTDAIKIRDLLSGMFDKNGTTGARPAGGQGQNQAAAASAQSVGRLAGQFTFQAIPASNRLVVITRSRDNLAFIDNLIAELDKPQTAGLPAIIELKHASAEDLAEQINALLSLEGTQATIRRSEQGLSTQSANVSPFAADQNQNQTQNDNNAAAANANNYSFWWGRARPPTDKRSASNLVGELRVVPVWRQNALMVVSPPEYKHSVIDLVTQLDRPGRQVLLSAIVLETTRDNATALGLRWSSQTIVPANGDNSIGLTTTAQGTRNDFAESLFNTSVLNANVNLNLLLQALSQKTAVTILSEPKIFTADNQEATFFDGQDVPFVNQLQSTTVGTPIQSFNYRAVGLQLRIRPRITPQRDVDLRVNLQLASIAPGQIVQNALIVDRRETTTQLILKDRQTIVISGILRTEDSNIIRKIPILGDIPILGELFKSREINKSNTDLLVFITPVVIENPDEGDSINKGYIDQLEQRRKELEHDTRYKTDAPPVPSLPTDANSPVNQGGAPAEAPKDAPKPAEPRR